MKDKMLVYYKWAPLVWVTLWGISIHSPLPMGIPVIRLPSSGTLGGVADNSRYLLGLVLVAGTVILFLWRAVANLN